MPSVSCPFGSDCNNPYFRFGFRLACSLRFVLLKPSTNRQHTKNLLKRDVLRRLVGNHFVLTAQGEGSKGETFIALNETFVVYADHPEVIRAFRKMHEDLALPDRMPNNLLSLVKAMAKVTKVPIHQLNDDFFLRPFIPPS